MIYSYPRYDVAPDLSPFEKLDCPEKNIIYCFNYDGISYWKIDIDLLKQTKIIDKFFNEIYFCNGTNDLNKNGYAYLVSEQGEYLDQYFLILALIYSKNKFKFDCSSHQILFDMLCEDAKYNFVLELDYITTYDLYDLGYLDFNDDVTDFIDMNLDFDTPFYPISETFYEINSWEQCFEDVDLFRKALDKKWKLIKNKLHEKKQYYQKQGCQILLANRAFDSIKKNKEYSLIAIEESEIYSVEYNRTVSFTLKTGQSHEIDFYTIVKNHENTFFRSVVTSDRLNLPFCQWALKKHHSGYEGKY